MDTQLISSSRSESSSSTRLDAPAVRDATLWSDDAKPDVIDEFFPRFRRDGAAAAADESPAAPTGAARMNTVNAKLLADIEKSKSQFRVEAPQVEEREDVDVSDRRVRREALESEFYPIMRISMIMRTVVLGAGTLLTGITGFAGVGLIALGAKVAVAPDAQIRDDGDDVVLPSEAARDAVDE
ncbi:alpha-ketoglutarate-dependent dioxygenase alkB-like protein [Aureococcus anophagefferens]|nr:alpha-ketoglutarate-dependent dioxygenase alkB-like protein [Aureococcus anophagefferens]